MKRLVGGIEGDDTKFICVLGTGPDDIQLQSVVPGHGHQSGIPRVPALAEGALQRA